MLKKRMALGLDSVRLFATIFLREVHAFSASQGKMWDYESGESVEQLQYPSVHGVRLWKWLEGVIMGEARRAIAGPSLFWKGSPPTW